MPARGGWRLTIREGSTVKRERFANAEEALDELALRAEAIHADGPLPGISSLRDFGPDERVAARLEISGPGLLHHREAGIDLMGDGSLVAYTGGISRAPLASGPSGPVLAALREALLGAPGAQ